MITVRAWFTKTGMASYISLLDLQRVMQRALKRSALPVWYTQGFNPHIYMTFAAPLSLGQESLVESVDFKTEEETLDWDAAAKTLTACLPQGVVVQKVEPVGMDAKLIAFARYEVRYDAATADAAKAAFAAFTASETAAVEKKGKRGKVKEVNLKEFVTVCSTQEMPDGGFAVTMEMPAGSVLNINPVLVLEYLQAACGLPVVAGDILRTALLTKEKQNFA